MLPDRRTFAQSVGAALDAPEAVRRVNDVLRAVLTTEPIALESDEQRLVRRISERMDGTSGDATRLIELARNIHALVVDASSLDTIELLLEFIADRERVLDVLRKQFPAPAFFPLSPSSIGPSACAIASQDSQIPS